MRKLLTLNHISIDLSEEEVEKLTRLYKNYHELYTCYQWKY